MMRLTKSLLKIVGTVGMLGLTQAAFATDAVLLLEATGNIGGNAYWLVSGTQQTKASFDFGQVAPGAGQDVNSTALSLELKHPGNTGSANQLIALSRPSGCAIGSTNVAQTDVAMEFDGTESATDTNIQFTIDTAKSARMRFKSNYGTAVGNVKCTTPGSLTYTYGG